jgi:hypothetical protein
MYNSELYTPLLLVKMVTVNVEIFSECNENCAKKFNRVKISETIDKISEPDENKPMKELSETVIKYLQKWY